MNKSHSSEISLGIATTAVEISAVVVLIAVVIVIVLVVVGHAVA
jgi:hypothetical protein